jgi:hypothetical protein
MLVFLLVYRNHLLALLLALMPGIEEFSIGNIKISKKRKRR